MGTATVLAEDATLVKQWTSLEMRWHVYTRQDIFPEAVDRRVDRDNARVRFSKFIDFDEDGHSLFLMDLRSVFHEDRLRFCRGARRRTWSD